MSHKNLKDVCLTWRATDRALCRLGISIPSADNRCRL